MRIDRIVPSTRRAFAVLTLAALVALAAGCSPGKNPVAPLVPPLSKVTLSIHQDSLSVGTNALIVATAYDTSGAQVSVAFDWRSTNPAVCTVTSRGLVSAVGEGTALVIATAGNKSDTVAVNVWTQNGWYTQTSNTARNLYGVAFAPDGRTGAAVGASGAIVATTDAGVTWTQGASSNSFDLMAVAYSSAAVAWAVGNNGVVMKSGDGGQTWTAVPGLGTSASLRGVCFANSSYGWVVGSSGTILRTRDGGTTWNRLNPTVDQFNSVAFSDTSNGWAVAETGQIWGTHDAGASWYDVSPSVTANALRSVWRVSNTQACAVGVGGAAPQSSATADSLAWTLTSLGAGSDLHGVHFTDATTGYAVGTNGNGIVLKTLNGGTTWTSQAANSTQPLNAVWFVDPMHGWAVGNGGRIVHTSRGGNQ